VPNILSVCLYVSSVLLHIWKTTQSNLTKFTVHVTCGRGSVLLWRKCNTLCTSGSPDDVMLSHNSANVGHARGLRPRDASHWQVPLSAWFPAHWHPSAIKPRGTQQTLAVDANKVLRTGPKSAIIDCLITVSSGHSRDPITWILRESTLMTETFLCRKFVVELNCKFRHNTQTKRRLLRAISTLAPTCTLR